MSDFKPNLEGVPHVIIHFDKDDKEKRITSIEEHNMERLVIPDWAIESIARVLYPIMQKYFENPDNVDEFNRIQAVRETEAQNIDFVTELNQLLNS